MTTNKVVWIAAEVVSPHIGKPVCVVVARNVPYIENGNRLQNLNIYLPRSDETSALIGKPVRSILTSAKSRQAKLPRWHVHIHGGAWRDPNLLSTSIEADVAHAFLEPEGPLDAVVSLNYTLSPFPTHPQIPYDPVADKHSDPAREAKHPDHIHDVLRAFACLRSLGLNDDSYILSGHSAGACLAFQASLYPASHWRLHDAEDIPRPAALLGMNGLYDLPDLVDGLGPTHEHLRDVYENLQSIAIGNDRSVWPLASPSRFDAKDLVQRLALGKAPYLVVVDQSTEDQLVPMNQMETMKSKLQDVEGLVVRQGHRCRGVHAAPWEQGNIIWESIQDVLEMLKQGV